MISRHLDVGKYLVGGERETSSQIIDRVFQKANWAMKLQITNTKLQINLKSQYPMTKTFTVVAAYLTLNRNLNKLIC